MTGAVSEGGLINALAAACQQRPDAVVIESDSRQLTGADLFAAVERFAATLLHLGVIRGARVAVQADKSVSQAILYLATLSVGAVYVPLNPTYSARETAYFLENAEPTLYICDPRLEEPHSPTATATGARVLTLDANGNGSLTSLVTTVRAPRVPCGDDELAVIIYTSGTTGRSKGAMLTHGNLTANARALNAAWEIDSTDVLLHALPLFHIHGLFVAFNTMLLAGGRIRWLQSFDPARVLGELPRCTLFMGVPTYYTRLLASGRLACTDLRAIRLFICGSAPLLPQTFSDFEKATGHRIVERYGMSECGIICSNPVRGERRAGAVGQPLSGVELRIVDEKGTVLPSDAPGGIEVRGPHVCRGYWRKPDSAATDFRPDGFFITGDLGVRDRDGYIQVVGRAKDLVISGGLNVYPREIELVLDGIPSIGESAVIGVPHPDFGEAVVAVICPPAGAPPPDPSVVLILARAQLAGFKLPKAVFILEELPRNAMGKVQKSELRERYATTFTPA